MLLLGGVTSTLVLYLRSHMNSFVKNLNNKKLKQKENTLIILHGDGNTL